jgi:hypothetical protein
MNQWIVKKKKEMKNEREAKNEHVARRESGRSSGHHIPL